MKSLITIAAALALASSSALAVQVKWTDWTTGNPGAGTATGTITTDTATITVSYSNPQGYGFILTGAPGETDYWQNNRSGRNPARSPYTGDVVENIPTGTDIIGLSRAGYQTLSFSQTVANPFFSYVSLNGNGYAFDRDFEILSFGDGIANDAGYWGPGTSYKNVVNLGGGNFEYQLLGTGEPHGTIRFLGTFDTVTWRSLTSEYWNGFTVGVEGTAQEVYPVPDASSTLALLALALPGLLSFARSRRS